LQIDLTSANDSSIKAADDSQRHEKYPGFGNGIWSMVLIGFTRNLGDIQALDGRFRQA
jgi:hypothetical protein